MGICGSGGSSSTSDDDPSDEPEPSDDSLDASLVGDALQINLIEVSENLNLKLFATYATVLDFSVSLSLSDTSRSSS